MAIGRSSRYVEGVKLAWIAAIVLGVGGLAHAGVFDGFGGREDAYLVGADKVCTPIKVDGTTAKGVPSCHRAQADEIAQLSVKSPKVERGAKAQFAATAQGTSLSVTRPETGANVVTWTSIDPISKVVDVYASAYGNVVAVEIMVRRGGRDQADVVAFDLRGTSGATTAATTDTHTTTTTTTTTKAPESADLTKAIKAARKTKGKAAIAAWAKVAALDADNSEARYGTAAALAAQKKTADAIAALEALAKSSRADAIEFLVAARFDAAFAAMRADPAFRKAVGLDRPAGTFYEHVMGQGGTWEQAGTSCDTPGVELALARDRSFALRVKTNCEGDRFDDRFSGTWDLQEPTLVLQLPKPEGGADQIPCTVETHGNEDAIHCAISDELEFTVRPVRR